MLFLAVSGCFAAGLGPYLLLPVRALLDSTQEGSSSYNHQSWGAHKSWSSFVSHLLRQEFGTFSLSVYDCCPKSIRTGLHMAPPCCGM
jgi:hypothetical protein